jgi:hypothetical protein
MGRLLLFALIGEAKNKYIYKSTIFKINTSLVQCQVDKNGEFGLLPGIRQSGTIINNIVKERIKSE